MKYIRMKDDKFGEKIYELVESEGTWTNNLISRKIIEKALNGNKYFKDIKVIAQADTIKELCDELVIKNPNNDGKFFRKVFIYENTWEEILNEKNAKIRTNRDIYKHDVEIFGAIWIYDSNGAPTLKSVAKVNNKGELELL